MKIKHLNTEFKYLTQKWQLFLPIKLGIIAYIFI